jgi:hypothetical protein
VIPALDRGGFFASTSKNKTKQRLAWTTAVGRVAKHLPWSLFQKEDQPEDFFQLLVEAGYQHREANKTNNTTQRFDANPTCCASVWVRQNVYLGRVSGG